MSKKYLRKIHFSEDDVWTYYVEDDKTTIFSPDKNRFEIINSEILIQHSFTIKPSIIKKYIEENLRNK